MKTTIQWDISATAVDTGDEAVTFIDEQSEMYNNWGTTGIALFFGPEGVDWADLPLRIDMDPDAGLAAIRWLPDNLAGIVPEFHHGQSIWVLEDSGDPLVEIPAELVGASIDTAKRVVAEYVETGQRPTLVTWKLIG